MKRSKIRTKARPKVMKFRPSLFWDVDPKTIDPKRHSVYVIERIMDFGMDEEVRWMWRYYSHTLLRRVAETSRSLHPKSKNFWRLVLKK
ncbi:MAG: hypothetical protein HYV34_03940 [Candidatus Kerfeldbacteria bacterium]|nr:hypothetical protein [Candidatus Kerfeldbacteria bacterium]